MRLSGNSGVNGLASKIALQCIWSITLCLGLAATAHAASKAVTKPELEKALAFYQRIQKLDVDFKQTKTLKDIQLDLKSEGHMTMTLPDHVQWKIHKPEPMTVDLEQQKITIHSGSGTQTFSQDQNPSAKDRKGFATMLSWLKLDSSAIMNHYDVTQLAPRKYRFTAKDKDEPMLKSLEMELTSSGHVAQLLFQEVSGDEIRLQFSKPKVVFKSQ